MIATTTAEIDTVPDTRSINFPIMGEHYMPLVNKTEDGRVYAHAIQTIRVEPETLYKLWRDVQSIPLWQEHVVSVTSISEAVSHWIMGNPEDADGKRIEFDSQVTEDIPSKKIAWESITPEVEQSGTVTFTPHPSGRGTVVLLQQMFKVPGGALGNAIASTVERGPTQTVIEDLRHFKEMAESGEIPSVKGQPHGPRGLTGGIKEWLNGETNPTPAGTSSQA